MASNTTDQRPPSAPICAGFETRDLNRTYLSELEKGASYPGPEIAKLTAVLEIEPAELLRTPRSVGIITG